MTKQYAIDMAKKLFRETSQSYFVIHLPEKNDYMVLDQTAFKSNFSEWNVHVIFSIEV